MEFCKVALLIVFGSCLASATHNYGPLSYTVPEPLIQAFKPRGVKVSIPHSTGVQLFAFHGNINKIMRGLEAGQLSQDVLRREGDRWVFSDPSLELHVGDKIYYWLFIIKDNLGYRYDNGVFEITEIISDDGTVVDNTPPEHDPPSTTCTRPVLNLTRTVLNLQEKIDSAKEVNMILKDLVRKHYDTATTLYLEGPLPMDKELFMVVDGIVKDKLGLSISVQNVARTKHGRITFKVATLDDKVAIIRAATKKLKNYQYSIMY